MASRVTIQDIADALGLSRNTVSKALNNSEGLADATRERILQAAIDMGYKQFAYARDLMNAQSRLTSRTAVLGDSSKREVALITTTYLASPHFSSLMLDAFQNELAQFGLTLNTHRASPANLADLSLPVTLDLDRVVAIVCIEMFDWAYDEMLCDLGVPILFVDGPAHLHGECLPADQLYMESVPQVMQLVNGMLEKGCQRIGFIGNWEHCQSFLERYSAFRLAMLMAGAPVNSLHCIRENHSDGIRSCLETAGDLPDLFICANDFVALDTLQALREMGLDVPHDVMLAGFDDAAESRRSIPAITTIHTHTQVMAYSAIQLLRTRVEEPSLDFRRVYTETTLIYRASTERN
ncbi:MAG: LacI family DNA-binding transcriptional regulator [Atopobiaceae bacterium]|nr:LacI family DNA-binding transcriptional regulator [Atopobiaceae bacterium]